MPGWFDQPIPETENTGTADPNGAQRLILAPEHPNLFANPTPEKSYPTLQIQGLPPSSPHTAK
jgi:hypothetical protein